MNFRILLVLIIIFASYLFSSKMHADIVQHDVDMQPKILLNVSSDLESKKQLLVMLSALLRQQSADLNINLKSTEYQEQLVRFLYNLNWWMVPVSILSISPVGLIISLISVGALGSLCKRYTKLIKYIKKESEEINSLHKMIFTQAVLV